MTESVPEEIAFHIAKRVAEARLQRRWTRDELARQSGVNVHTLKRFESTGAISLSRLIALCNVLGMLDDLVRAFKPRQRISVENWQIHGEQLRQRGRRSEML